MTKERAEELRDHIRRLADYQLQKGYYSGYSRQWEKFYGLAETEWNHLSAIIDEETENVG
jgi:hypothetical protein